MNSRSSKWFETSVRYERQMEDASQKKVTELYVVEALSFSEAEVMITQEMSSYVSGEFEVKNITPATYGEIFFSENANDFSLFPYKNHTLLFTLASGPCRRRGRHLRHSRCRSIGTTKDRLLPPCSRSNRRQSDPWRSLPAAPGKRRVNSRPAYCRNRRR